MSEWVTAPLHSLAEIRVSNVDKKTVPSERPVRLCNYMDVYGNDYIRSDIPFMEATANAAEISRFKVDHGDVMITKDSETPSDIGIPAVVMDQIDDLVCGYHLALIKPNRNVVDSVYLAKQLATDETARYFGRYAAGSTRYGLSNGAIAKTQIRLAPLRHQKKIAAILTSIDTAIEKTEALIEKYQQIKAGLMHDLFTRGVLHNGQLRPPREQAPELYQETAIGWIPRDWSVHPLQGVCKADITYGIVQAGPDIDGGIPYIRTGDMAGDVLDRDELLCTTTGIAASYKRSEIVAGEIVIAIRATVGKVLPVPPELTGANLTQGTARIAPRDETDATFLLWAIRDSRFQKALLSEIKGTTFAEITLASLRRLPIAAPISIHEQAQVGQRIKCCDDFIRTELENASKFRRKKLGLMQDLLTGKVPVKVGAGETAIAG